LRGRKDPIFGEGEPGVLSRERVREVMPEEFQALLLLE
jgi:hypothetical protein